MQLVALAAKKLREDGHGYPGDTTEEEWHAYLEQIEADLKDYKNWDNLDEEGARYALAQDAMRRFVDRMGSWWD